MSLCSITHTLIEGGIDKMNWVIFLMAVVVYLFDFPFTVIC